MDMDIDDGRQGSSKETQAKDIEDKKDESKTTTTPSAPTTTEEEKKIDQRPLPDGWAQMVSPDQTPFYYNERTKESRWVRPVKSEEQVKVDELIRMKNNKRKKKKVDDDNDEDDGQDVEEAIEELSEDRKLLQSKLSGRDALLEPQVKKWMTQWLRRGPGEGSSSSQVDSSNSVDEKKQNKKRRLQRDVDHVIEMLSSGYQGHGDLVRLCMKWLDELGGGSQSRKGETVVVEHFKDLCMKTFSITKLNHVFDEHQESPPEWLTKMLAIPVWRDLLIKLVEKHKSSTLLDFTVKSICENGHHAEVAKVMHPATFFAVFKGMFIDLVRGMVDHSRAERGKMEEELRELCIHSQYTFTFAMDVLHNLLEENERLSEVQRSKIRRLIQSLENAPRDNPARTEAIQLSNEINRRSTGGLSSGVASGGHPELGNLIRAYLGDRNFKNPDIVARLKHIYKSEPKTTPTWPIRRAEFLNPLTAALFDPFRKLTPQLLQDGAYILAVATARKEGFESLEKNVCAAIEESVEICKDPDTLTLVGMHINSDQIQMLAKLVREYPVVSAGVVRFARSLLLSEKFHINNCFSLGVRSLLYLIRCAVQAHPLQHVMAFFTICHSLQIYPRGMPNNKLLEIKQALLDELIVLVEVGFVFPVLDYVRNQSLVGGLDLSLIRYFVIRLGRAAAEPFSGEFARTVSQLLNTDIVARAIRIANNKETTKQYNEFKQRCYRNVDNRTIPTTTTTTSSNEPEKPPKSSILLSSSASSSSSSGGGTNKNNKPLVGGDDTQQEQKEVFRLVPFDKDLVTKR